MPRAGLVFNDGEELEQFVFDSEGVMHRRHVSLHEDAIMAENQAIRSSGGARSLSFAKPLLRMSYAQYLFLQKLYPGLTKGDAAERKRLWLKIAKDTGFRNLSLEDR